MRLRRAILTFAVLTTLGLGAGCADDPGDTPQGAASTASSAAPEPSIDLKANTEAVCKAFEAAYEADKMALLEAFFKMISAKASEDEAALATARAEGQAVVDRIAKAANPEIAKAADPKVKAALEQLSATIARMMTAEALEDPDFEADLDKALADAGAYCPALKDDAK